MVEVFILKARCRPSASSASASWRVASRCSLLSTVPAAQLDEGVAVDVLGGRGRQVASRDGPNRRGAVASFERRPFAVQRPGPYSATR